MIEYYENIETDKNYINNRDNKNKIKHSYIEISNKIERLYIK